MTLATSDVVGDPKGTAVSIFSPRHETLGSAAELYAALGKLDFAADVMAGEDYEKMLDYISRNFDSVPGVGRDNPISSNARQYV